MPPRERRLAGHKAADLTEKALRDEFLCRYANDQVIEASALARSEPLSVQSRRGGCYAE